MSPAKDSNWNYNKQLQPLASALRSNMTKAEACLWKYVLRAGMMKGYTFRRQRPIMNYIADFMCKELMLVIEVDGLTHSFDDVLVNDEAKANALTEAGYTVLRFTDNDVLQNIESIKITIQDWISDFENRLV